MPHLLAPSTLVGLAGLFALGFTHALGPDHLAALAALKGTTKSTAPFLKTVFGFALGHTSLLLVCGLLSWGFGWLPSAGAMQIAESVGGMALMILGGVMLHASLKHGSLGTLPQARHLAPLLGGVFATSGTRTFILAVPATAAAHDLTTVLAFSGAFGLGIVGGMLLFGLAYGASVNRLTQSPGWERGIGLTSASLTIALGAFWAAAPFAA